MIILNYFLFLGFILMLSGVTLAESIAIEIVYILAIRTYYLEHILIIANNIRSKIFCESIICTFFSNIELIVNIFI